MDRLKDYLESIDFKKETFMGYDFFRKNNCNIKITKINSFLEIEMKDFDEEEYFLINIDKNGILKEITSKIEINNFSKKNCFELKKIFYFEDNTDIETILLSEIFDFLDKLKKSGLFYDNIITNFLRCVR